MASNSGVEIVPHVGRFRVPKSTAWMSWFALVVLPGLALALRSRLPAWAFMWALGFAMYGGFKWLTWWQARASGEQAGPGRSIGYLLLWPGMDARTFLSSDTRPLRPTKFHWALATGKTAFGVLLFWGLARLVPTEYPLLTGWVGLLGLIFLIHFGLFHVAALAWQAAGVDATPVMRAPGLATSLADFWGNRWNLAFRQLAYNLVVRPLRRHLGVIGAGLAAFLASGLVHEFVISLPAAGGYGLPTAYFTLQGLGLLFERSRPGRRLGLGRGFRGRLFTALITASPAFWLFHPLFIARVILPFMKAVGAV